MKKLLILLIQTLFAKWYPKNSDTSELWLSTSKMTFKDAYKTCIKLGRRLAAPKTNGDYLRVRARIPINLGARTWVGFKDALNENIWRDY